MKAIIAAAASAEQIVEMGEAAFIGVSFMVVGVIAFYIVLRLMKGASRDLSDDYDHDTGLWK